MYTSRESSMSLTPTGTGTPQPGAGQIPKYGTVIPNRVFVGGIAGDISEVELKQFFSAYGSVKDCKIITDRGGVSKSYGFVTFENFEDADRVLHKENEGLTFKDRRLNVGPAIRKQQIPFAKLNSVDVGGISTNPVSSPNLVYQTTSLVASTYLPPSYLPPLYTTMDNRLVYYTPVETESNPGRAHGEIEKVGYRIQSPPAQPMERIASGSSFPFYINPQTYPPATQKYYYQTKALHLPLWQQQQYLEQQQQLLLQQQQQQIIQQQQQQHQQQHQQHTQALPATMVQPRPMWTATSSNSFRPPPLLWTCGPYSLQESQPEQQTCDQPAIMMSQHYVYPSTLVHLPSTHQHDLIYPPPPAPDHAPQGFLYTAQQGAGTTICQSAVADLSSPSRSVSHNPHYPLAGGGDSRVRSGGVAVVGENCVEVTGRHGRPGMVAGAPPGRYMTAPVVYSSQQSSS